MSHVSRPAALNPEPSYREWRSAALKSLQQLNPPAVAPLREGLLTRCYVQGFSPHEAAEVAARDYDDSGQPPSLIKKRR